jgi:hypothetical protein
MRKRDMFLLTCEEHDWKPVVCEKGGSWGNIGYARVIADKLGKPKPILERHIRCGEQGLFLVEDGDYIVEATYEEDRKPPVMIEVYQVTDLCEHYEESYYVAVLALVARRGHKLRGMIPDCLTSAVKAAEEKMMCRCCDHVHYGLKNTQEVRDEQGDNLPSGQD